MGIRIGIQECCLAQVRAASLSPFGVAGPRNVRLKNRRWENRRLVKPIPGAAPTEHGASRAEAARTRELQRRDLENVSCSSLPPDVLAGRNRIEDAIPSRLEVKRRHIEKRHWIVLAPTRSQKLPPIPTLLRVATIGFVHYFKFLELAGEDEQTKEAKEDSQHWAYEGEQGREIAFVVHIYI